jgi:DNA-binding NarL/FixJ family response regulator
MNVAALCGDARERTRLSIVPRRTAALFDPHPMWLDAVEHVLEGIDVEVVCRATTTQEALEQLEHNRPDLLIAEIQTAEDDLDGIQFVADVAGLLPDVRVLVLTDLRERQQINRALAAGAVAYILKSVPPEDFAAGIRLACERSIYLAGPSSRMAKPDRARDDTFGLTTRELEILRLVVEGYTNPQLAKMLWVTEPTIKFHLSKVYRKLGVANRTEAARWAVENGAVSAEVEAHVLLPRSSAAAGAVPDLIRPVL